MTSKWDNIKKNVKNELSDAAATTKKYFKIGKGKLDIMSINNSLKDTFLELGVEVYSQITEEVKGDIRLKPKVKSLIEKINQLKQLIKDEELEIDEIKKESDPQVNTNKEKNNPSNVKTKKKV
ncbi:MAG: hypothetical protein JXR46_11840 [Calditrichaceae bacterium]|nr:hypothetical protein [Calditrichaceae bacterium]MBN2709726.1 hypothetical protein [Calditrichaceae bacterium]RQV92333.1 MAG: hypothetical protein EH224_15770 [Calditrichota bacterium]